MPSHNCTVLRSVGNSSDVLAQSRQQRSHRDFVGMSNGSFMNQARCLKMDDKKFSSNNFTTHGIKIYDYEWCKLLDPKFAYNRCGTKTWIHKKEKNSCSRAESEITRQRRGFHDTSTITSLVPSRNDHYIRETVIWHDKSKAFIKHFNWRNRQPLPYHHPHRFYTHFRNVLNKINRRATSNLITQQQSHLIKIN